MRRLLFVLLVAVLALPFLRPAAAAEAAPAQQSGACTNTLVQPAGANFWVGQPAAANTNGPVVVFVHGYTGDYTTWTGSNNATRDACNNGFRVAAVNLGGTASIWDNATDLTAKLQAIASYYGVAKVNIMAHSKGGIDSQTAIVHNGAHTLVQRYIAFATPFGGTDLADHACAWYGWAIWQCNDGTWTLRTGYMSYVRSITDGRPEHDNVLAYAARGSKCDWYNPACAMISGADDGVVPTWSVWASGEDSHISDRSDLRHGEVHQTQRYNTGWLFGHLGRATLANEPTQEAAAPHFATSAYTLRGGELTGKVTERIVVEGGLKAVHFTLLSTAAADVTLTSPSGKRYTTTGTPIPAGELLQGILYPLRVPQPEAGIWQVEATPATRGRAGYLLRATYEGGLTIQLDSDLRVVHQPGSTLPLALSSSPRVKELSVAANLRDARNALVAESLGSALTFPATSGTYTLDLRVTGIAADGTPFERTLVTSLAAVDVAKVADPASIR